MGDEMDAYPVRTSSRILRHLRAVTVLAVGMLLPVGLGPPVRADGGDLDPTFGTGGRVTIPSERIGTGYDVAFQANGKIVVGGTRFAHFTVARFRADGRLDRTFAGDGIASGLFSDYGSAAAVVVQRDGKIVAIGHANAPFTLVRFRTDGTLDASFGSNGKVQTPLASLGASCTSGWALRGALAPNGKIVVAGEARCSGEELFVVARYRTDGTLDSSFDEDGVVRTKVQIGLFESQVAGVVVRPGGTIVVAGSATYSVPPEGEAESDFAVLRFTVDGTLDGTFGGGDGIVTTKFTSPRCGGPAEARGLALTSTGKIVVVGDAGCADVVGGVSHLVLAAARYRANGTLDPTFGGDGKVVGRFSNTALPQYLYGVAIQLNGRIVASGTNGRFTLVRFRTDGRFDSTFGNRGVVRTFPSFSFALDVAIQKDGRIVATGSSDDGFVMARYLPS
jgi:uncharacterized delta-60 repeat protein